VRRSTQSASLSSLLVLLCATLASAQGTTVNAVRGRISERMVVGSTTLGDVLRIVGSSTVSSGTGTMNPAVVDSDGDVLEDSFTTVSTAGAHTWGAAGQFSSTLGVTGATTLSSTLGVTGATTLSSTLSVTGNISGSTGTLLATSPLQVTTSAPFLRLIESGAGTDETVTELLADADTISLDLVADALGTRNSLFKSTRTGLVPGDLRWGALLGTIRPENNGGSQLGSLTKMYSTAYIWDLVVSTLTAKEVISTIGGEVIVAPTTTLTRDVAAAGAFIYVKHNQIRTNDTVYLKVNGSGEKMLVTANYIDCSVSGNCISVANDYAYAVTRNRQGSGAKDWLAGAAVVNEGNVGDGTMSWYADRSSSVSDGYVGVVVSDGPVAYWRMEAATATTSVDLMGNVGVATETGTQSTGLGTTGQANLGTTSVDPTWSNTSAAGYLLVANDSDLQITGDLTIEFLAAWQATSPSTQHIISRNHTGEYHVAVLSSGELQFCHGNTSTFTCYNTAAGVVTSTWTHYAVVRDATSSPKRILFYKNGALISTSTYTQAVATTTNTLGIGQNPHNLGFGFDGWIDEPAIYNYQLAADRILLHSGSRTNDSISRFTIGPTGCGLVRTGTGAFDMSERWCFGNLAGTYDYSTTASRYGFAAGSITGAWFGLDATNGLRGMYGTTPKFGINMSGVASFVEGAVTIDNLGIRITNTASTSNETKGYTFIGNETYTKRPGMFYHEISGNSELVLSNDSKNSGTGSIVLSADVLSLTAAAGAVAITGSSTVGLTGGGLTMVGTTMALTLSGAYSIDGNTGATNSFTCPAGQAVKTMNYHKGIILGVLCGAP
jgi:fibronectin-binding autotransporter adhesin